MRRYREACTLQRRANMNFNIYSCFPRVIDAYAPRKEDEHVIAHLIAVVHLGQNYSTTILMINIFDNTRMNVLGIPKNGKFLHPEYIGKK